jgi:hypothetical protein
MALKNNSDVAFLLTDTLDLILKITSEVYAILRFVNEQQKNSSGKGSIIWNEDQFKLCTLAIDNGIIDTVSMLLALTGTAKQAKVILGSDGSVLIASQSLITAVLTDKTEVATPTLGAQQVKLILQLAGLIPEGVKLTRDTATLVMKGVKTIKGFTTAPKQNTPETL